ncbi:MAG: type VI secretion system amidase effector protein Tae4 [Nannocystales bacterium]
MGLPNFDKMWSAYPTGTSDEVKRMIGGGVNGDWVANTCVIRISHCFNEAGVPIPNNHPGLTTTFGANKKRYAFRVTEFKRYLETKYGAPNVRGTAQSAVQGKKGIIMFDVQGWSDATGHFDLWDGKKCVGSEYFDKAHAIYLWNAS